MGDGVSSATLLDAELAAKLDDFVSGRVRPSETNGLRERLIDVLRLHLSLVDTTTSNFCSGRNCEPEVERDFVMVEHDRLEEMMLLRSVIDQIDAARELGFGRTVAEK